VLFFFIIARQNGKSYYKTISVIYFNKKCYSYNSLIDSMVIDAEFGRKDHGLIPLNCDKRGLETHDTITDPQAKLNWW
jgi:hypothetical protein